MQDILILMDKMNKLGCYNEQEKNARIEFIKSLLPSNRISDIKIVQIRQVILILLLAYMISMIVFKYERLEGVGIT